jgi:magnesium chelatase subunit I
MPALAQVATELLDGASSPARIASAVELVLEGLHLSKRLNKDSVGARSQYRGRG